MATPISKSLVLPIFRTFLNLALVAYQILPHLLRSSSWSSLACLKDYPRSSQWSSLSPENINTLFSSLQASMSRKRLLCLALLAYVTFLGLAERSIAEQQNITIDDAYPGGDPSVTLIYLPVTGWIEGSVCVSCEAHVDPSQTVDGTWHDASSNTIDSFQRSIEFNFTGMRS